MERVLVQEARELSLLQSRFQKLSQQLLRGDSIEGLLETLDDMLQLHLAVKLHEMRPAEL